MTPRSLDTNVIFLSGELTLVMHRALTAAFKKKRINVTVEQFSVLALLFYKDGINQQEMSIKLNRNKTTIARIVSNMERNKLITRTTDKNDSRGKLIFLTAKGKSVQQRAIECSGALYMKAVAGTKMKSLEEAAKLLNKIISNFK